MIISKKIDISILLLSVCMLQANHQEVTLLFKHINDKNIEHYVHKVETELKYNTIHRKVILTGALTGLGYMTYQLLYGGETVPVKSVVTPKEAVIMPAVAPEQFVPVATPVIKKPELTEAGVRYINLMAAEKIAKDNRSLIPSIYYWAKENFYTVLQQTVVLALFTGLNNALGPISKYISVLDGAADKFTNHFFHAGNLSWFLKRHTQLSLLFATLEFHAAKLENRPVVAMQNISLQIYQQQLPMLPDNVVLTQDEKIYHAQQLQRTWDITIQQFEYVLGFMTYASKKADWYSVASLQATSLEETMRREFDSCASLMEAMLHDYVYNHLPFNQSLFDMVRLLHFNIEQDLNAFADLEKLKSY